MTKHIKDEMSGRYEVRVFRKSKVKNKDTESKNFTTYGVWDKQEKNWVINSTRVGLEKAETILYMLEKHKEDSKKKKL